jgi:hypothetical protein
MTFSFTDAHREQLLDALGRRDSAAWHLLEDVELALDAYAELERPPMPVSPVATDTPDLAHLLQSSAALRSALYGLPEHARRWARLGGVSSDRASEVADLADACGALLDQLSLALTEIQAELQGSDAGTESPATRLVHALGQAFRNRTNIKPSSDDHGLFRRFLTSIFELIEGRYADLDELSKVLDSARLDAILGS